MTKGAVTISIDLELAWGNWDDITGDQIKLVEHHERSIVARLVEIFERHEMPVTWAIVAALLDRASATGRPGREEIWYAPDVIELITSSRVSHDIGSHGGRHIYLDAVSDAQAEDDLAFASSTHRANGLGFTSFVFPRNKLGKKAILERQGIKVFRGEDRAWHQRVRSRQAQAGRIANLVDKILPIAPEAVAPQREGAMVNLPGSMLFMSKNGLRKFAAPGVTASKLNKGLVAAMRDGAVFHLWFHPSNFYHDAESQFGVFENFVQSVRGLADKGLIDMKPMASFAAH